MRINLRIYYYKLRHRPYMESEIKEPPRIPWNLQAFVILECLPYFITVSITARLINLVLGHERLEWDEIFKWRSYCFAIFSFLMLSLANYGDRIQNGRFYIFALFLFISSIWTPLIIGASAVETILVFSTCLQPLLIVREASRMCFLVQPLILGKPVRGIRLFFFLLFLFANLGAFFFVIALRNLSKPRLIIIALVLQPVYQLLAGAAFSFGGRVIIHRNIVERGFKCLVRRFEQSLQNLFSPLCKCLQDRKIKDYRKMYDPEIVTCTKCILRISITLAPFVIFFATVEMSFYTWIRDYDVLHDLGYAEWEITLMDVYHSFNILTAIFVFLAILPLVESLIAVHDCVLLSIAYFILLLSWISTSSLQYVNEIQQTPYPIENQASIVVFSNLETPTLLDSIWTKKRFLSSGDVEINKIKISGLESRHSSSMWARGNIYQMITQSNNGTTTIGPEKIRTISFKGVVNSTVCYLLTTKNDSSLSLLKYDDSLNRHFLEKTKSKPKTYGHLFTLCSRTLFGGPPYYLVIQHLRTRVMRTVPICKMETSITNLTVGWYNLFLRENRKFVQFEMLVGIRKEALHYLYISKDSSNLTDFKGNLTSLVTPFFSLDKSYFLIPLGLFAIAFTVGIISMHSFVLHSSPKHLHEFAFAIMYTTWSVGGGIAGLTFRYFCANSRGMFFWVMFVVLGILLFARNALVFIVRPHACSPDGWMLDNNLIFPTTELSAPSMAISKSVLIEDGKFSASASTAQVESKAPAPTSDASNLPEPLDDTFSKGAVPNDKKFWFSRTQSRPSTPKTIEKERPPGIETLPQPSAPPTSSDPSTSPSYLDVVDQPPLPPPQVSPSPDPENGKLKKRDRKRKRKRYK